MSQCDRTCCSLRRRRPGLRKTPHSLWNLPGKQPPGTAVYVTLPAQSERCGPLSGCERRFGPRSGGSQVANKRRTRTARSAAGAALRGQELASETVAGREKEAFSIWQTLLWEEPVIPSWLATCRVPGHSKAAVWGQIHLTCSSL